MSQTWTKKSKNKKLWLRMRRKRLYVNRRTQTTFQSVRRHLWSIMARRISPTFHLLSWKIRVVLYSKSEWAILFSKPFIYQRLLLIIQTYYQLQYNKQRTWNFLKSILLRCKLFNWFIEFARGFTFPLISLERNEAHILAGYKLLD